MQIDPNLVCALIVEARQVQVKVPGDLDASNPSDDGEAAALLSGPHDQTRYEMAETIKGLSIEEQQELVALVWLGRGDFEDEGKDAWAVAVRTAAERADGPAVNYLLGTPLLGDFLEEGLSVLGHTCGAGDVERLS